MTELNCVLDGRNCSFGDTQSTIDGNIRKNPQQMLKSLQQQQDSLNELDDEARNPAILNSELNRLYP